MKTVKMAEMTVLDIRNYLKTNKTILIPYGVVEQHGYHLPLDTDIRNAEVMGEKIAEKIGCIMAPTLNYCFSGGMLEGTINVKPATFCLMMGDIIESLSTQGFRNFIIVPGHGGSESLMQLKESLRILKWLNTSLHDSMILMVQLWNFSPTWLNAFKTKDYHAGEIETSLLKYWTPEVVREKIAMDDPKTAEMFRQDPDAFQVRTCFSDNKDEIPTTVQYGKMKVGVMGYPERASVATGKKVTDEMVKNAGAALRKAITQADTARKNGKKITLKDTDKLKILSL